MKTVFREVLITLAIAIVLFLVLRTTIQSSVVVGPSMEPGLQNNQRLVISKVGYVFGEPQRGDVIIFHSPNSWQTEYIKRIIGIPGDTIEIKAGRVYVNGVVLNEPYVTDLLRYNFPKETLASNSYFVLGDNRNNSNDSHNGWTVPRESIVGKAWLSIWPPGTWGLAPNYPLQEQLTASGSEQNNALSGELICLER